MAPVVLLSLTSAGVFYAWLKDRSGSVWPVAFAHATESGLATFGAITVVSAVLLLRGRTWGAARTGTV
ncbi:hypothetical protein NOCA2490033 [metagenome]|uniref:Abortive infection protein n=1 Tax=metagenome TaxID=256318 RepID=A0A2P2C8H7_9ZZZZ